MLIEADYRMKLVGIGLEEGVPGVASYLSSIELDKEGNPPPMNMLRWWFTLNYDALAATEARDAFELRGPGVKVLSENELLTERGERVHTGDSDELTKRFAESFTKHFDKLSARYPIYAELRNVFDLSLVAAIIHSHDLPGQVGWHLTHFGPDGDYRPSWATRRPRSNRSSIAALSVASMSWRPSAAASASIRAAWLNPRPCGPTTQARLLANARQARPKSCRDVAGGGIRVGFHTSTRSHAPRGNALSRRSASRAAGTI